MAVLVTRPHPDNEATAATLRARGLRVVLAPVLRFESLAFQDDLDAGYGAVIVTSANALRGFESHPEARRLLALPLFAVGEHTAAAARRAGFTTVSASQGGVNGLRDDVVARVKAGKLDSTLPLLYLAGADLARDLAGELGMRGFSVVIHTTYRMTPVSELPPERTMSVPEDQSIAFFAGKHDPLFTGRVPYWQIPRLKGLYDPDPYHSG